MLLIFLNLFTFISTRKFAVSDKHFKRISILAVFFYVPYQLGMLEMYLSSMPFSKSIRLAQYSRYHNNIVLFLVGLALISVLGIGTAL